ncbi:MAG TPA: arylsulfotransferase family protein [Solirubrobacteraceae bacterium]|nr:arylsulfotransferase family protein [Solirubrobacteraceae bacterium]
MAVSTVWRRIALLLAVLFALMLSGCGSAGQSVISVFPLPGSRLASSQTQIVVRGIPARRLSSITVTGSQSGPHSGRLLTDSDHRGESFLPAKPFAAGETVTVRLSAPGLARGRKSWHFFVAEAAGNPPSRPLPPAPRLPGDVLVFHSRPDLDPPAVEIVKNASRSALGDVFITPQQGPLQNGAMIVSPQGELMWFKPVPAGDLAANVQVQHYQGRPVLTWWQGYSGAGLGFGEDVIVDSRYRQIAVVRAANGLSADLHEFELTPHGTALITAYYPVFWDATSIHQSRHMLVLDSVVQEIDVKTGLVLFQWDSLDHVPLSDSYEPIPNDPGQPYDYFHINAIDEDDDGNLIISARNTWAAYKVNLVSGQTIWTLGGKHSTFKLAAGANFAFQHDVRVRADNDRMVTVFDDGAGPPTVHKQSRGLTLRLDTAQRTATAVKVDQHPPALLTSFEGNLQQLANGDQFIGWGEQPYFTEFNPQGHVVFEGRFVDANSSYRAYRFPWTATPITPPAIAASTSGSSTIVYVSWNGATTVAAWRILAGPSDGALSPASTVGRQGFETQAVIPAAGFVAAQALDAHGRVLSVTPTISPT